MSDVMRLLEAMARYSELRPEGTSREDLEKVANLVTDIATAPFNIAAALGTIPGAALSWPTKFEVKRTPGKLLPSISRPSRFVGPARWAGEAGKAVGTRGAQAASGTIGALFSHPLAVGLPLAMTAVDLNRRMGDLKRSREPARLHKPLGTVGD